MILIDYHFQLEEIKALNAYFEARNDLSTRLFP